MTVARIGTRLDQAARNWLRLLQDPCSAPLANPCYESPGTGLLMRVHTMVPAPPTAVDYVFEFCPQNEPTIIVNSWSATPSGSLGNAGAVSLGGLITNLGVGRVRCAAACAKFVYTGKEVDRSGLISGTLAPGAAFTPGEPIAGSAIGYMTQMPRTERFGARNHEYKWAPSVQDGNFVPTQAEERGEIGVFGNTLRVALSNVPPGQFYIDLVTVWEWVPATENITGSVNVVTPPPSSASFNAILRQLGDIGKFAIGQVVDHLPALIASQAMPLGRIGPQFAALTL